MMPYVPPPWTLAWPTFRCSRCQVEHPCPERDSRGVWPFPTTATTVGGVLGWSIICLEPCERIEGDLE